MSTQPLLIYILFILPYVSYARLKHSKNNFVQVTSLSYHTVLTMLTVFQVRTHC